MIITGAFLAERSGVMDDKLQVWGGVITSVVVSPEYRRCSFDLVVLAQEARDDDINLTVEFIPPTDDEPLILNLQYPPECVGGDTAFATFHFGIDLPFDGKWVVLVSSGGANVSLPLTVIPGPARE